MLKGQGFELVLASHPDYSRLVAEIYFDGKFFALISNERGTGSFDLETPGTDVLESTVARRVDLRGFVAAAELARCRLGGTTEDDHDYQA